MTKSLGNPKRKPTHPGSIIREDILPKVGMTPTNFAKHLGISKTIFSGLISEKRGLTADLALRISMAIGGSPTSWLRMQEAVDLWDAEKAFQEDPKNYPEKIV